MTSDRLCRHFPTCGGCQHLDLPYATELEQKQQELRRVLAALDLPPAAFRPILAAAQPLHYRSTLKVPFAQHGNRLVAGFFERGSHRVVPMQECFIQHPLLVDLLRLSRSLAEKLCISAYDERRHQGHLRHLVARVGAGTGEVLAAFVVRRAGRPAVRRLAQLLMERFQGPLVGVLENTNAERTNVIWGPQTEVLVGRDHLREEAAGLRLRSTLDAFAQNQPEQAERLYDGIAACLEPLAGRRIADLYAGSAPIGLRLARRGARVVCVERNPEAAAQARQNAEANDLPAPLECITGSLEDSATRLGDVDGVVIDPPRKGLSPAARRFLVERPVRDLVYVSCNPGTLARDLMGLRPYYEIVSLQPVDLFPRTRHLETVVHLRRAPDAAAGRGPGSEPEEATGPGE